MLYDFSLPLTNDVVRSTSRAADDYMRKVKSHVTKNYE